MYSGGPPATLQELQQRIIREVRAIRRTRMVQRAVNSMNDRAARCIGLQGHQVEGRAGQWLEGHDNIASTQDFKWLVQDVFVKNMKWNDIYFHFEVVFLFVISAIHTFNLIMPFMDRYLKPYSGEWISLRMSSAMKFAFNFQIVCLIYYQCNILLIFSRHSRIVIWSHAIWTG